MNTITHALLPVIIASVIERTDRGADRNEVFSNREIIALGVFGAAPDLLNPHLSLAARYTSWSHGFPFWVGLTLVMVIGSLFIKKRFPPGMAIWLSAAYLLHLVCDLVAGGIAWSYPLGGTVVGKYYVRPEWWAWIDGSCIFIMYGMWRIAPSFHRSQETKM